jgi:peptidoglycan L-alanyl-D-glutamate endopeptidase CwlK
MNATSEKRLSLVHPELARRVRATVAALATKGLTVEVVQGLRTFAEQNALYAQGRTKPGKRVTNAKAGQSNHNFGLAVDLCPFKNGQPDWNDDAGFHLIGLEAKRRGLEWGGAWRSFVDMPHVQLHLPNLTVLRCFALYQEGGLPLVWSEAERQLGVK